MKTCVSWTQLPPLLEHEDAQVRARAANLVGNLARHSADFYAAFSEHRLLPRLIDMCADPDASARKFACFAIGNAGAHG